jgi:hypothetical protein
MEAVKLTIEQTPFSPHFLADGAGINPTLQLSTGQFEII